VRASGPPSSRTRDASWGRAFWGQYIVVTTIGFAIGGFLAGGIIRAIDESRGAEEWSPVDGLALGGAVFGLVIGILQWLVLRTEIARAVIWIPATSAGWAASFALLAVASHVGGPSEPVTVIAGALAFATIGPVVAIMQWLVLGRPIRTAGPWVVGSGVSFVVAILVAVAVLYALSTAGWFRPEDFPSAKPWGVLGAVAGPLYGAATGAILRGHLSGSGREL
jgi:hypothetical protein